MLTSDGKYEIYIIQHIYNNDKIWRNSGDCTQFLTTIEKYTELTCGNGVLQPFTAAGKCWQKTGIYGSFDSDEAFKVMVYLANQNKKHKFRVAKVIIEQTITPLQ